RERDVRRRLPGLRRAARLPGRLPGLPLLRLQPLRVATSVGQRTKDGWKRRQLIPCLVHEDWTVEVHFAGIRQRRATVTPICRRHTSPEAAFGNKGVHLPC